MCEIDVQGYVCVCVCVRFEREREREREREEREKKKKKKRDNFFLQNFVSHVSTTNFWEKKTFVEKYKNSIKNLKKMTDPAVMEVYEENSQGG